MTSSVTRRDCFFFLEKNNFVKENLVSFTNVIIFATVSFPHDFSVTQILREMPCFLITEEYQIITRFKAPRMFSNGRKSNFRTFIGTPKLIFYVKSEWEFIIFKPFVLNSVQDSNLRCQNFWIWKGLIFRNCPNCGFGQCQKVKSLISNPDFVFEQASLEDNCSVAKMQKNV